MALGGILGGIGGFAKDVASLPGKAIQARIARFDNIINQGKQDDLFNQDLQAVQSGLNALNTNRELAGSGLADILSGNQPEVPGINSFGGGPQALPGLTGDPLQDARTTDDALQNFLLRRDIPDLPQFQTPQGLQLANQSGLTSASRRLDPVAENALAKRSSRGNSAFNIDFGGEETRANQSNASNVRIAEKITKDTIDRNSPEAEVDRTLDNLNIIDKTLNIQKKKKALAGSHTQDFTALSDGTIRVNPTKKAGKPTSKKVQDEMLNFGDLGGDEESLVSRAFDSQDTITSYGRAIRDDAVRMMRKNGNLTEEQAIKIARQNKDLRDSTLPVGPEITDEQRASRANDRTSAMQGVFQHVQQIRQTNPGATDEQIRQQLINEMTEEGVSEAVQETILQTVGL